MEWGELEKSEGKREKDNTGHYNWRKISTSRKRGNSEEKKIVRSKNTHETRKRKEGATERLEGQTRGSTFTGKGRRGVPKKK